MSDGTRSEHVAAYLARIGLAGRNPAELRLEELVAGHNRSIPFENLDPLAGIPVVDLGLDALSDKLVARRRGGYCYEHNMLLAHVLRELGYDVDLLTGRVEWGGVTTVPARTHQVLAVTAPGRPGRYLVDVGFGGQTLSAPIELDSTAEQETRHEPYRLSRRGDDRVLETLIRGRWQTLYVFGLEPQEQIDLEVGSWYVSTYPGSVFRHGLTVALVTDDARVNLSGTSLALHHRDGHTERVTLDGVGGVLEALRDRFGLDPDIPDLDRILARELD